MPFSEPLGTFIIYKMGEGDYRLCVAPVAPEATVIFEKSKPIFSGANPFGNSLTSNNLDGEDGIIEASADGVYAFTVEYDNGANTTTTEFSIQVKDSGAGSARMRWVNNNLTEPGQPARSGFNVVLTVTPAANEDFSIAFVKENFTEAVLIEEGLPGSSSGETTIFGEGSTVCNWEGTAGTTAQTLKFRVKASSLPQYDNSEVIGGEDGDLDIDPGGG